ncbi:MAG TPA: hypothetical protein VGC53_15095, partial [Vicinamibacteria bacterium]
MKLVASLLALVLFLAGAGVAYYGYQQATQPFKGYTGSEIFFTVRPGQPSASIARALESEGITRDHRLFVAALWFKGAAGRLQAGEYRFEKPLSTVEVIDQLVA